MCSASMVFPILNTIVQYLANEYSVIQIVWARYVGHLALIGVVLIFYRRFNVIQTKRPRLQVVRSLLLVAATFFYFTALSKIPVATATAINFTGPLIIVALSIPILGETVGPRRWVAVGLGFLGALIIIQPGFGTIHAAAFLVLGCATCNALYQILTRSLAGYDSAETSIFYTALFPSIIATLILPFGVDLPKNTLDWVLLVSLGLVAGLGHYFVIKAYENAEASVISSLNYLQLIGATLLGYFFFQEFPDVWTWLGSLIIIVSGLYIMRRQGINGTTRKTG